MEHEWKVGDRFTLEFEVTGQSGVWVECCTQGANNRAFPPSDMQHTKLIQPAVPEPRVPEIKVGQKWITRGGEAVTIISDEGPCTYPFRYKTRFGGTRTVTRDGWHSCAERPDDEDLMRIVEAPEPQKLDTSKPMRLKRSGKLVEYIDRDEFKIVIRFESGYIEFANEEELENIPEPKRTTTQLAELVNFDFGPRIMMKSAGAFYVNVTSRAKITYTEGEGWSIEEVEA